MSRLPGFAHSCLPVRICLETCVNGREQQVAPEPRCEDPVLIYLCTSWLAFFAQPLKGVLINLKRELINCS